MIEIREIHSSEFEIANNILSGEGIVDDISQGIVYVLIKDDKVIGISKMRINNGYGILDYIVLKKENRGLDYGDGLLRAVLFKAKAIGIEEVYYAKYHQYLIKKGFNYTEDSSNIPYELSLNINNFFNNCCCGDENEI